MLVLVEGSESRRGASSVARLGVASEVAIGSESGVVGLGRRFLLLPGRSAWVQKTRRLLLLLPRLASSHQTGLTPGRAHSLPSPYSL